MQRFTLIHDGSNQGWQTAYLAFRIAARLGAPLLALLVDPATDGKNLTRRAAQVEVGGRAAELVITTRFVTDHSVRVLVENSAGSDGLFVPRNLIPDSETAQRFLQALSCPLWVISQEAELRDMAVLVADFVTEEGLINYTTALSRRIQQSLIGLVHASELALIPNDGDALTWMPLADFTDAEITAAVAQLDANLLFLSDTHVSMFSGLLMNCVFYPVAKNP